MIHQKHYMQSRPVAPVYVDDPLLMDKDAFIEPVGVVPVQEVRTTLVLDATFSIGNRRAWTLRDKILELMTLFDECEKAQDDLDIDDFPSNLTHLSDMLQLSPNGRRVLEGIRRGEQPGSK